MSNLKHKKETSFQLLKKLEAMDKGESIQLGNNSNYFNCIYKPNFTTGLRIEVKKLIDDLRSSHFKSNKFDAENYTIRRQSFKKNYREKAIKEGLATRDNIKRNTLKFPLENMSRTQNNKLEAIERITYEILSSDILLNMSNCYIETDTRLNTYDITVDANLKKISLEYYIPFKNPAKNPAIIIKTGSPEALIFFLERVYGKHEASNFRKAIYSKFFNALNSTNSISNLVFLYDNLPGYIKLSHVSNSDLAKKRYKIPDKLLWKHFKAFFAYDKGTSDASYYVLSVLSLITPYFCMHKFMEDQSLVLEVYNNLDDKSPVDSFFGYYELSETFDGNITFAPTNQDAFVTLLNTYMQLFENNGDLCVFDATGVHYRQGTTQGFVSTTYQGNTIEKAYEYESVYRLDSNILFSNTGENKNKVYLFNYVEITKNYGESLNRKGQIFIDKKSIRGYTEKGYYNPLDVIKFTQYNEQGEAVTMNVPALFVKYASDVKEWERVDKAVRFGFNILEIVVSVATIYSGASSLMLYAALADLGLATTDVLVQSGKEKGYFKEGAGKEFYDSWEQIYTIGSLATFSPVAIKFVAKNAPKLVKNGAELLQVTGKIITDPNVYEGINDITKKAIYSLEIPNFNKTGLEIVKKGVRIPGLRNIQKLQNIGVIFVRGAKNTVAAIYKGIVIASGKVKIVALQLRRALLELKNKKLENYLDELVELAGSTEENLKIIRNPDAFIASAKRLKDLKITSKNAIEYLDEALPHFNHEVKVRYINGVLIKEVDKIARNNCVSVVEKVEEFLRTGIINKAESVSDLPIDSLEFKYGSFKPLKNKEDLISTLKDGDRGIVYGIRKRRIVINPDGSAGPRTEGHVFNFVKEKGKVMFRDGQSGLEAIFESSFQELKYVITN